MWIRKARDDGFRADLLSTVFFAAIPVVHAPALRFEPVCVAAVIDALGRSMHYVIMARLAIPRMRAVASLATLMAIFAHVGVVVCYHKLWAVLIVSAP